VYNLSIPQKIIFNESCKTYMYLEEDFLGVRFADGNEQKSLLEFCSKTPGPMPGVFVISPMLRKPPRDCKDKETMVIISNVTNCNTHKCSKVDKGFRSLGFYPSKCDVVILTCLRKLIVTCATAHLHLVSTDITHNRPKAYM
jgi:hypothetical protein